jgi:copper chaperone CopZ
MTKISYRAPDMHCSACVMTLEGLEDDVPGIKRVVASYHTQTVDVEYDEEVVTSRQIIKAAEDLGYTLIAR